MSAEDAKKAQEEKEAAEAALKKELGEIEIKNGDYQIQVHIIEARELKVRLIKACFVRCLHDHRVGQRPEWFIRSNCLH